MNTQLQIFEFENQTVRTVELDDAIWFVAKDVSFILGYSRTADSLRLVDSDDKLLITNKNAPSALSDFDIPDRGMYLINESGMYSMVLNSRREDAKRFKKWVTSEVLPTIRKTGQYQMLQGVTYLDLFDQMLKIAREQEARLLNVETKQQRLEDRVNEALPRDEYITIMGFCIKYNLRLTTEEKRLLGLEASKICRERKIFIDEVPDKRYGRVHVYPEELLSELVE